jgi:Ca2+-binding EF-hand superfamily protein
MFLSVISSAAALVLASAMVPPAHPSPDATYRTETSAGFDELDRNKDGILTPDELPASHELSRRFAEYDRDGDNALSRSEFDLYMRGGDTGVAAGSEEEEDDEEE